MSEGCGLIVMETEEHALARGATIYCELAGYGSSCDAHHITAPAPGGDGLKRCMEMALKDSDCLPTGNQLFILFECILSSKLTNFHLIVV